ncbi:hypothetical protein HZF08_31545 [Paenibacillus sp. CGMCC 1.16610]|uniref:DUF1795 domain-containing protein n=1 Tax=Paenibacillus anseongense TaxID=2682845 RepID=A0ABW9UG44_9BACL|nr:MULTISPECIES: hypothetical protein [Paenibacillus]MBA2942809.1 hypothetical protein [Paenibacillus sp. CGMCC 1.16610]MVQ38294.1 hypothetical protein [Paenibacillus anseongense]
MSTNYIIFAKDSSGSVPVEDGIIQIASLGISGEKKYQELSKYIAQALDYLKNIEIPKLDKEYLLRWDTHDINDESRPLSFKIVLKATSVTHVYEFRINWEELYYRALFFVYDQTAKRQFKIFTKSLLKAEKNPPELQKAINETQQIAIDFFQNPSHFLKEWSE